MITVSVKGLVEAIEEARVFSLPDMTEGTRYLYDNLYRKLSCNTGVGLSEIDFGAFTLDDVDDMRGLYSDVLAGNEDKADRITRSLRDLPPAVAATAFV